MKRFMMLCAAVVLSAGVISAEDIPIVTDEDALFGSVDEAEVENGTAGIEKIQQDDSGKNVSAFLKTESVRVGGSISPTLKAEWLWTDPWGGNADLIDPDEQSLPAEVEALLFVDARPEEDFRVYASVKTDWPFNTSESFLTSATYAGSYISTSSDSIEVPNIQVFELFSDFNWKDSIFFRFGKHTVKWGVGYFWSPADVLNLTSIDFENPTKQREGPMSLRAHFPVPGTQTNLWGYLLVPDVENTEDLESTDLGAAGKLEFVVGGWELGAGGFYQKDRAKKGMITASGSIDDVGLFGEVVLGWGSDTTYITDITPSGLDLETEKRNDGVYFSGTGGFIYLNNDWDLTLYGQYYYNGETYSDRERKDLIEQARSLEPALSAALGSDEANKLLSALIYGTGRHYVGFSATKDELWMDDLSVSILSITNLSDLSGFVKPTLTYEFFDRMSSSIGLTFYWSTDSLWGAGDDGEYVVIPGGPAITFSISASLGAGRF